MVMYGTLRVIMELSRAIAKYFYIFLFEIPGFVIARLKK